MTDIIARPLSDFPSPETPAYQRQPAKFLRTGSSAGGDWSRSARRIPITRTLGELDKELQHIGVRRAVLELDISERDCRQDGGIRADARPKSPRVVLSFEHPQQGPTRIPADRFDHWADNVRAIRLALEALRAVDRYGITRRAEQYRGWQALPATSSATLNAMAAAKILIAYDPLHASTDAIESTGAADRMLKNLPSARESLRRAAKATHPDTPGGETEHFQAVQAARGVLAAHFGVTTL